MADYATLLRDHVTLKCRCIDRIFLQAYVPKLQTVGMEWGRQMAFVNHFYFYLWDAEWGGAFWKTNAYAPFPIWLWLNGHEWAKRQLEQAGIRYEALANGFRSCDDPVALQQICDRMGSGAVQEFFARWSGRLPAPLTPADLDAGYTYELAFRQFRESIRSSAATTSRRASSSISRTGEPSARTR